MSLRSALSGLVRGTVRRRKRSLVRRLTFERLEPRLCLSTWSDPVNLGPNINSQYGELEPALSPNGLSLYFDSNRPGGSGGSRDLYISQRASPDEAWGEAQLAGAVFNRSDQIFPHQPNFSRDGHFLFFVSSRPGGYGRTDIWVSYRKDTKDDFGWQTPVNLGPSRQY